MALSVLEAGKYSVWFRTALAEGMGVVTIADGSLNGRDTIMSNTGRWQIDNERFEKSLFFINYNDLVRYGGGEGGIRTPDRLAPMPPFECGAFDHSLWQP